MQDVLAKERQQIVGQGMELEAKSIGSIGRARQPVAGDVVLELFDEVFGLPALLVPAKDVLGSTWMSNTRPG